ncbi:MAG: AMIN domain-containing protein [Candidatus Eisenbacteria sp.]|nr:AMIN domain-containing protein [Candidatus Eisenbacteria bacterium]
MRFCAATIATILVGTVLVPGAALCLAGNVSVVSDVRVDQRAEGTCIFLQSDGPLKYVDFTLPGPDRIVVDCFDTHRRTSRERWDAPEGSGIRAIRVSQYRVEPRPVTRMVIDLGHRAPYIVKPLENGLLLIVNPVEAMEAAAKPIPRPLSGKDRPQARRFGPDQSPAPTVAPAPEVRDDLITLEFQNADIQTVLRSFSDYGGVNIIWGPEVKGAVTVHLENVPWREALGIVLRAHSLSSVEENGIIRVGGSQTMENEEITRHAAARKKEELQALQTSIVRVKFANAEELLEPLRRILGPRGSIDVETRTNAILVTDIAKVVTRIENLVAELDTRTPQVEINAKIVDVDASVSRDLGIDWTALELMVPSISAEGRVDVSAGLMTPVGQFTVGKIEGPNGKLEMTLTALERENKANIISNPRIRTLDNMEARILVGKKIPLIVSDEAGNPITEMTTIGIQMTVTPHINADGQITLDLHPEVSDLASQSTVQGGIIILTSEARTRVMVKDGETVVIGGLIRNNETEYTTGVPFLRSLPLVGRFFRSTSTSIEKRELLIFVTPRIVE